MHVEIECAHPLDLPRPVSGPAARLPQPHQQLQGHDDGAAGHGNDHGTPSHDPRLGEQQVAIGVALAVRDVVGPAGRHRQGCRGDDGVRHVGNVDQVHQAPATPGQRRQAHAAEA